MSVEWCRFDPVTARLILHIHARPNAKTTAAAGLYGDALKINIAAPAVDDKANAALIAWLAIALGLPRSALRLKSGATARRKVIEAQPATPAAAARAAALAG
jgi:uncharacterized protein YggU (UPF0235/DUF167 family)